MTIHPSVLELSKRLERILPFAGIVASATFLLSLSPCVYPGHSATLMAAAAGVIPPSQAAHPAFALIARGIAACPVPQLSVRLNLLPALCGTLCAMLLARLISRTIFFYACEDAGGGGPAAAVREAETALSGLGMPPEVDLYNRRVLPIAAAGGLLAAFLLVFTAPVWSAATRLDTGLFDLLLALASLSLFPRGKTPSRFARLTLSLFLFIIGLSNSAVFLLLSPFFALLTFKVFWFSRQRNAMGCCILAAGLAGFAFAVFAFWLNTDTLAASTPLGVSRIFVRAWAVHHYHELRAYFPHSGWILVSLQTGFPAAILLFGKRILFKDKNANTLIALLLIALAAAPGLLNLPAAPQHLFQTTGHLPVFGCAILASAVALACAACLVARIPDDLSASAGTQRRSASSQQPQRRLLRRGAQVLLPVLLVIVAAAPVCGFRVVDARRGAFADAAAREMLAVLGERTWMITNGYLDNHLLLHAHMLGKPLTLVTLRPQDQPRDVERLKQIVATSPTFEGLNRQRLQNALTIGTVRFVLEWFSTDPKAGARAMVWATPDIWTACGYRAIPEGLAFGGRRADEKVDLKQTVAHSETLTDRIVPLLLEQDRGSGVLASLCEMLRMKAGLAANELGVLLEEMNETEAAYQAYVRSSRTDPMNVSAALNAYALVSARGMHPEALDLLKKRIKTLLADRRFHELGLAGILQNYGTVRQKAFYQQQAALWSARGNRTIAADNTRKALALSKQAGVSALIENAAFYANADNADKAEACYLAALEQDASNKAALSGISMLMVNSRKTPEAEKWLKKAFGAGFDKDALLYQTIRLAMLKGDDAHTLELLTEATKKYPKDLRFWTLLADLLLKRGDTQLVEFQVLPQMLSAVQNPDHFLIHAVRGYLLKKKGASNFREARLSLLKTLSLNTALPDVWNTVLELDMSIGELKLMETDVKNLLRIYPDHALANYLMGSILLARGALAESEDYLRRSIVSSPTAAAFNDLAENLRRQKRLKEAEAFARQAAARDPSLLPALDTLASVLVDAGNGEAAAEWAARAVAAQPKNAAFQLTLLRAQIRLGDTTRVHERLKVLKELKTPVPAPLQEEIAQMK